MEYYFGEHLRWGLGWETPNQAGAFLATLFPWLWVLVALAWDRRHSGGPRTRFLWRLTAGAGLLAEGLLFYALAHTYSRGALVGLLIGAVAWMIGGFCQRRGLARLVPGSLRRFSALVPWGVRMGLWAVCLLWTGFHARLAPEHLAEDRSSLNRLVLWRGGTELIAASPVHGWGWGQSGAAFMEWTQPLERTEGYLSMVNSYLTVAVEAGLPLFVLLLAVVLVPLFRISGGGGSSPSEGRKIGDVWGLAAAASWACWLTCMVFSNLWIFPLLWITPGAAAFLLLILPSHGVRAWRAAFIRSAALAGFSAAFLWMLGLIFTSRQPLRLARIAPGVVEVTSLKPGTGSLGATLIVVPDSAVLGENPGPELRRWLLRDPRLGKLRVLADPGLLSRAYLSSASAVLLCGEAARASGEPLLASAGLPVWLLHPTLAPPSSPVRPLPPGSRLIVPGIDITGEAAAWRIWAAQATPPLPVEVSQGLAVDVRPHWPYLATTWTDDL